MVEAAGTSRGAASFDWTGWRKNLVDATTLHERRAHKHAVLVPRRRQVWRRTGDHVRADPRPGGTSGDESAGQGGAHPYAARRALQHSPRSAHFAKGPATWL